MAELNLTRRDTGKIPGLQSGQCIVINVKTRFHGHVLEMADVHFHHDSAVLLPDYQASDTADGDSEEQNHATALSVLASCYVYASQNPSQVLLIAGHTDTTGRASYNLTLSEMRADNVLHVLLGNREEWTALAQSKHKVEDYQQILKWVAGKWGWDCDPGEIDDREGPETQAAITRFQQRYKEEFEISLTQDGIVGRKTWGAFFDLYMRDLAERLETDEMGLASWRSQLNFVDPERQAVGCGENFPIEAPRQDDYRSSTNRRVEILFFDPDDKPLLECSPRRGRCFAEKCEIYNPDIFKFKHIPPDTNINRQWVLRLLKGGPGPLTKRQPLANESFVVSGAKIQGTTDGQGMLRVPVDDETCTMVLRIAGLQITLEGGTLLLINAGDDAIKQRLYNLGYGKTNLQEWNNNTFTNALKQFQKEHNLPVTGTVDGETQNRLKSAYGS
jgi:peptidoglycan hydrolase-like protein with peptidoglycan-binding domain